MQEQISIASEMFSNIRYKLQSALLPTQSNKKSMSFMNWLFGKQDKKPEVAAAVPAANREEEKKIEIEAKINNLEENIKKFEDQERKLERKIELFKTKAKQLILAGRQKEGKKYAKNATSNQRQLDGYSQRKKLLVDKKCQLEQILMDLQTVNALKTAVVSSKEQEDLARQLEKQIFEINEGKQVQNQIEYKLKNMVGDDSDDEETNDLFAELINEAKNDKQKKIEAKKEKTQPIQQAKNEFSEIDDMLANL